MYKVSMFDMTYMTTAGFETESLAELVFWIAAKDGIIGGIWHDGKVVEGDEFKFIVDCVNTTKHYNSCAERYED